MKSPILFHFSSFALATILSGCNDMGSGTAPPVETGNAAEVDAGTGTNETPVAAVSDASGCEAMDSTIADADASLLFDYARVPTFDFFLPQSDWEALQLNARDEQYAEAQLCFEGRLVGNVGLRFKGYYGSLLGCFDEQDNMICPRLSMKVKFSEYEPEQRLFGLKRLNFNAYRFDDSRIKEKLAYDLYRSMGIVAPRASWAVLRVNGESQGLYGMVEQVDGRFATDRWPDHPDGNLYKELWPTETDPGRIASSLKTNEDVADVSSFVAFSQAVSLAAEGDMRSVLGSYLDMDYLNRYLAVDDAIASYDGISYFWTDGVASENHNFYFYEEAPDSFTILPWDVESSFWINPDHATPHWTEVPEDCSTTYPYWDGMAMAPACDPVFAALASDLSGWRAASRELLDGPFDESTMLAAIDRYASFIGDEARADPTPNVYGTFDGSIGAMRSIIRPLRERLEGLIAE